jgi:hypothetical protein
MFTKGLQASHNSLKITIQEILLKVFFTRPPSQPNQGVGQKGLKCQKGWSHNLQGLTLQTNEEIDVLKTALEAIGQ